MVFIMINSLMAKVTTSLGSRWSKISAGREPLPNRVATRRSRATQGRSHSACGGSSPPASRQLHGRPGWRDRVGDYRTISTIDDGILL